MKNKLRNKLNLIKEEGVVSTDDPGEAEDLAKKGVNVKLTNEEEEGVQFSKQETKDIAKKVGRALIEALRAAGDEIDSTKVHNIQPNSFDIYVKYKNNFEDDFVFYIHNDALHLVDFSFDKQIGQVGIKPSGQGMIHADVVENELLKHFKSLNEQDSKINKLSKLLEAYKAAPEEKRVQIKPKVQKAVKHLKDNLSTDNITENSKSQNILNKLSEDLDIGHQDDEPEMLKRYAYDTATYAVKLYKLLNKYDQLQGEVDFPNWWQEKVMRARQDISKAQHYLEFKHKQPKLDKLALQEQKPIKEVKSFEESGLMIKGSTEADNSEIGDVLEDLDLYGEWNPREGYWLVPEEEDMYDQLESILQKQFNKRDISAYFEGIFENIIREQFEPNIAPGSIWAIQIDDIGKKVTLKQDNGQMVVIHKEDLHNVVKMLDSM